jgi:XRE family aerobic/anaerobic benzoate catabolism transcriptional regulator
MQLPRSTAAGKPPSGEFHEAGFLAALGQRVREFRNRRGMTRKMLSREADVSERHLAQLESGDGNISVVLLKRIAQALGVTLEEIFAAKDVADRDSAQFIREFLERLPLHRRLEMMRRLEDEFRGEGKSKSDRIAFIGLRGAGKTTLGSMLADTWGVKFVELDSEIEKDAGMALEEIFSLYGQAGYRRFERRILERVLDSKQRAVLSVGGGVVSERETYDRLLGSCYTVWVKAQPEEHMSRVVAQGDLRAMAENDEAMDDLRRILSAREPLYRMADFELDTSGDSVEQSFAKLKKAIGPIISPPNIPQSS